jgi:type IV pilus assembly protein PilM
MAIGLDIGSSAIRAVELEKRRGGGLRLTHYGVVALPPGAVVEGDVVEQEVVAKGLRELWRKAKLRRRAVALGLASQRVTVRQLELPDLPGPELAAAVRLQVQDQLPMPIDQAVLDHVVLGRNGKVRLLLVAAERDMVDRLLAAVTAARLRPLLVDLDAFALVRSLASSGVPRDDVELVVDIGATVTKIAVHRGGCPLFVRMVRLGGEAATRQLQQVLDLSWEDAETAKLGASAALAGQAELDPDDERARVLRSGVQRVVTEVSRSLDFFRGQHEDAEIGRVVLAGGASLAPKLAEQLQTALDLPVEQGDPLQSVETDLHHQRPFLGVPVGLAMALL